MKYVNPFQEQRKGEPPPMYDRADCAVYQSPCGRGQIVTVCKGHYDYVVGGRLVTQRAGKSKETLDHLIACVFDGVTPDNFINERAVNIYRQQG